MAAATWLNIVLEHFAEAGEGINAQLAAEGLTQLTSWQQGMPKQLAQANTPWGFYEWSPRGGEVERGPEPSGVLDFEVGMLVAIGLADKDPGALQDKAATYVGHITAALEAQAGYYNVWMTGFSPMQMEENKLFDIYAIELRVAGQRTKGRPS